MRPEKVALWGMLAVATCLPAAAAAAQATDDDRVPISRPVRPSTTITSRGGDQTSEPIHIAVPQITVATPPAAPALWPLHDRILWAAYLILALVGYAGILVARSTLKRIEQQAKYVEEAIASASAAAQTALLHAQAMIRSERPWIAVTAESSPDVEHGSIVVATNRGRGPARIVATVDRIVSAVDEAHLPPVPEYGIKPESMAPVPMILLPGESTAIRTFGRQDVKRFCLTGEKLKQIEDWTEKIFIYGKVTYRDLNAPDDSGDHESSWCCWYIYGQNKSGLVAIRVPAFAVLT
ncbi:MAG TPA: hypothetical protein VGL00_21315 [Terracidiphilus sp.]